MALTPERIREARFKAARRGGYDQAEVEAFLDEAAAALEAAENDATAMEARARAAVARLQELAQPGSEATARPAEPHPSVDEAETISRTLVLAQHTADTTIAEAEAEAERLLEAAREQATAILDESRREARRAGEEEKVKVEGEVEALLARREFLASDVDHLEQHLVTQRERIAEAVGELTDLVQRVPNGLGDVRRPLLSAAADDGDLDDAESALPDAENTAEEGEAPEDAGAETEQVDVVKPWDGERT